jgi:hypothetical protein
MPDIFHRAFIFLLPTNLLPHKNPQRKVYFSEKSGIWEGAWEYV